MKKLMISIFSLLIILEGIYASSLSEFEPIKIGEVYTSDSNQFIDFVDSDNYVLLEHVTSRHKRFYHVIGGEIYYTVLDLTNIDDFEYKLAGILEANNPYSAYLTYAIHHPYYTGELRVGLDENRNWIHIHSHIAGYSTPIVYFGSYDHWYYFYNPKSSKLLQVPKDPNGTVTSIEGNGLSPYYSTIVDEQNYFYIITGERDVRVMQLVYYPLNVIHIGDFNGAYPHHVPTLNKRRTFYLPNSGKAYITEHPIGDTIYLGYDNASQELTVEVVGLPSPSQSWTPKTPSFYDKEEQKVWRIFYNGYEYVFRVKDLETGEIQDWTFGTEYSDPIIFQYTAYFDGSKFAFYNYDENKYEVYQVGYYLRNNESYGNNENNNPISVINQNSWTNEPIIEEIFEIQHEMDYYLVYYHDPDNYGLISDTLQCPTYECFHPLKMVINGELYHFAVEEEPRFVTLLEPNNEDSIIAVTPSKIYYGECLYCANDRWRNVINDFNQIYDALPLRYINNYGIGGDGEVSEWVVLAQKNGETEFKLFRVRIFHYGGYQISEYGSADENMYFVGIDWYNGYFVVKNIDTNKCIAYGFNPEGWTESIQYMGMEDCGDSYGFTYNLYDPFTFAGKGYEYSSDGKARVYWLENYYDLEYADLEIPMEDPNWYSITSTIYDPRTKMAFRVFQDPNDNWNYILKAKNLLTGIEVEETLPAINENGGYRDLKVIFQSGRPFDARYLKMKEGDTTTIYKINVLSYIPANIISVEIGEIDGIPQVDDVIPISFTVQEVPNETIYIEFFIDDVYQDTIIITENDGIRNNGVIYVTYEYQLSEDWEEGTYEFQFYGENLVSRTVQVIETPENDEVHLVNTSLYNQDDYGLYWEVTVEGNGTHHLLAKIDNGTEITVYNGYINLDNEARTFAGTQTMNLVDGETYVLKVYLDGTLAGTQEFTYQEGTNFWEIIEDGEDEESGAGTGTGSGEVSESTDPYQSSVNTFFGNPIWIILLLVISAGIGISAQIGVNPLTIIGGLIFFISMFGFINVGIGIGGLLIAVIPYVFNRGE